MAAILRDNWGIAATNAHSLHPSRQLPAPTAPDALDRLWLRVDDQALVALPRARDVGLGIRIALHRLDDIARDAATAAGLRQVLSTLPPALAAYKRLDGVREELIRAL